MGNKAAHPGSESRATKVTALMRFLPRALAACGTGFAVSLLAACGGGAGLLSGDQSNSLSTQLDQVGSAVNAGDCGAASSASQSFSSAVSNLQKSRRPSMCGATSKT